MDILRDGLQIASRDRKITKIIRGQKELQINRRRKAIRQQDQAYAIPIGAGFQLPELRPHSAQLAEPRGTPYYPLGSDLSSLPEGQPSIVQYRREFPEGATPPRLVAPVAAAAAASPVASPLIVNRATLRVISPPRPQTRSTRGGKR